jgi:glycosyltransferase involved in cell wall biosynthesis
MKILELVNAVQPDQMGGLQRYVGELSDSLVARGHQVTIITKRISPDLPFDATTAGGARLQRLKSPQRSAKTYAVRYPVGSVLRTRQIVAKTRADVVHAHFPLQGLAAFLARRPYVYTFHNPVFAELAEERGDRYSWPAALDAVAGSAARRLERFVVSAARERLVLSAFTATELYKLTTPAEQVHVLPGGVDTTFFTPGDPSALADEPWLTAGTPVIFCARRLVPRTGVDILIRASAILRERFPDLRVVIAGDGFLRPALDRLVAELELGDVVRLIGVVTGDVLRAWYRRAAAVAMPTAAREGFGLSTVEALACATPVVGTSVGATPEILRDVDPRLVAPGADPATFAAAVADLCTRDDYDQVCQRSRAVTVRRWSWETVAKDHELIYARVAQMRKARTAHTSKLQAPV